MTDHDVMAPADIAERRRIEQDTDRTLFVSAGAGSGKTTSLVNRVAQLVLVDGVPMARIATVTFTIKAGAELRDRLRERFEKVLVSSLHGVERERAQVALDELDLAAIGTLHAFAQQILNAHPIEAKLPPQVEVLDEVASSIAFDERWTRIQQELLDDDAIADTLILAMAGGVALRQVRQLVRLLSLDWDRVESHVLAHPPPPLALPPMTPIVAGLIRLGEIKTCCVDTTDLLYDRVLLLEAILHRLQDASNPRHLLERLAELDSFTKGRGGRAGAWPGHPTKGLKDELMEVKDEVLGLRKAVIGQCLRHLTYWAGRKVLAEAEARRRSGQLEFHDLLVLSRDLLVRSPDTRAALQDRYQRLLLDEFQDTDPIQIELAVRIAGGRDASAPHWRDVVVPDGRLFVVGDAKQSIYRFRRASIATYLGAQEVIGEAATLSTNFRSGPAVIDWVNGVFETLIQFEDKAQPAYESLIAHRSGAAELVGAPVTVLGATGHGELTADALRSREATDVAGIVNQILAEGWTVFDDVTQKWRPARRADIAVLLPSRTSMALLEDALDAAGVHFRAESMSLVYEAPEIRDLLITARAIADPSDALALVTALRSPLFACGDNDLWAWRSAGGHIDLFAKPPSETLGDGPVAQALTYLSGLHRAARWLTPSEVLSRIVDDRRLLEIGIYLPRTRDSWRRLRFVVDQARAWTEVAHGGIRTYLGWVAHQAQEKSRVSEAILPETDVDAVRVMTVHAAKGLEFPIVIMSGMTTQANRQYGVRLLWTANDYTVSLSKDLQDPLFETEAAIDEAMGSLERIRLLYVAATRARDHLIVSLHRSASNREEKTAAELIESAQGAVMGNPALFTASEAGAPHSPPRDYAEPPPDFDEWSQTVSMARANSRRTTVITASGLEGTDPEVVLREPEPGTAKGARDLDLPPWSKGRYGSAVGRAVHAVLQALDFETGAGLEDAARAQSLAEAIPDFYDVVVSLARSALDSDVVRRAATREHWREIYVGAPAGNGQVMEGIIDLLYREDDGSLVVVDYKTDVINQDNLAAKTAFYRPQLEAYRTMLLASVSDAVISKLLFLHPAGSQLVDL